MTAPAHIPAAMVEEWAAAYVRTYFEAWQTPENRVRFLFDLWRIAATGATSTERHVARLAAAGISRRLADEK